MTIRARALVVLTVAVMVAAAPGAGAATTGYVALGDSYAAGSGVSPLVSGAPWECIRSSRNAAHLVAGALGFGLADVTCAGARTNDMTGAQFPNVAPQFDALRPDTQLVTVQIGGNDLPFGEFVAVCGFLDLLRPTGSPCKDHYTAGGIDRTDAKVAAVAPKVAAILQGIHQRSPQARVLVVGYPAILPPSGGCWPVMPVSSGDVPWLDGIERRLNAMLAAQASANQARFVDTYTQSIGHDACKPRGVKWLEPVLPNESFGPIHPNAAGEAAMARAVEAAVAGA
jgi:lysophospholipase L1-like esterase